MENIQNIQQFYTYLLKLIDSNLDKDEAAALDTILRNSENARMAYYEFMEEYLLTKDLICKISIEENICSPNKTFDRQIWEELAQYERSAPELIVERPKPPKEEPQRIQYSDTNRRINKVSLAFNIASLAAFLLFVAYLDLIPQKNINACAVLVDSIGVQWGKGTEKVEIGGSLYNYDDGYYLDSGMAKIRFNYGAELIIEGPSSFSCQTAESLHLKFGKIYVHVPSQTTGFSVDTPSSKIIDLGTEFGIYVNTDGATDVHMLKGKAALIPGLKGHKEAAVNIEAGQAAQVDTAGQMRPIEFKKNLFVRRISSANQFVWRGEEIGLTDGLIIHLKADSLLLNDGDPVTSWLDSAVDDSVNGTVSQLSGYGVPTFKTNAYNGMPAVRFTRPEDPKNASNMQKQVLASDDWSWDETEGVTIFIFCTGGISSNEQRVVQVGKSSGETYKSFGCDVCSDQSGSRDNNGWCLADSPFGYGDWHVSVRQIAQGARYGSVFYAVDGITGLSMKTNKPGRNIGFDAAGNDITIGNGHLYTGNWAPMDWYDGDVAEVLVYNRQLTMKQKQSVVNYLLAKYDHLASKSVVTGGKGNGK